MNKQQQNMVKNTFGGNKHKGQARKDVVGKQSSRLRLAKEDGEVYACVTKMEGGFLCSVMGADNITRSCIIRGKFRGGKRRDNIIKTGTWVLVGDRDWQSESKDKKQCDLLEVYADSDKERLKTQDPSVAWHVFNSGAESNNDSNETVVFTNSIQSEYVDIMEKELSTGIKHTVVAFGDDDEEVDVDDI